MRHTLTSPPTSSSGSWRDGDEKKLETSLNHWGMHVRDEEENCEKLICEKPLSTRSPGRTASTISNTAKRPSRTSSNNVCQVRVTGEGHGAWKERLTPSLTAYSRTTP